MTILSQLCIWWNLNQNFIVNILNVFYSKIFRSVLIKCFVWHLSFIYISKKYNGSPTFYRLLDELDQANYSVKSLFKTVRASSTSKWKESHPSLWYSIKELFRKRVNIELSFSKLGWRLLPADRPRFHSRESASVLFLKNGLLNASCGRSTPSYTRSRSWLREARLLRQQ